MSRRKPSKENVKQSASSYFSGALDKCRQETTNNGVTEKEFMNCLLKALGKDSDIPIKSVSRRRCSCSCVMKVLWIMFLAVLAFSLFVAAYSPLAFFVQKLVHDKLFYLLQPLRLIMVTITPYMAAVGLDFMNSDCLITNPFLQGIHGCPCYSIKHPVEITTINSELPSYLLESGPLDVFLLRNYMSLDSDFSINTVIDFPLSRAGRQPWVCQEIIGESPILNTSDDIYEREVMSRALKGGTAWTMAWLECPEDENPLTLHELIPSLRPPVSFLDSSSFSLSSKWAISSHYVGFLPNATMVIVRVLIGEARFVIEPAVDTDCFESCSSFLSNPILRAGDALVFDQRSWSYRANSWTNVTFISTQALSYV